MALDQLSRDLANGTVTRRQALAVLAATAVGALIPFARVEAQTGCRRRGEPCGGETQTARCCGDLVCRRRGSGNNRICVRPRNDDDDDDD
jgi:hypothetical protein